MNTDADRAPRTVGERLVGRAIRFVKPVSGSAQEAEVIVTILLHNQASTLRRALASAMAQRLAGREMAILILDDRSTDDWSSHVEDLLEDSRICVVAARCGNPANARNALLDLVDQHFPRAVWSARLDADDELDSPDSLNALVQAGHGAGADFVLGSNHLVLHGQRLPASNIASAEQLLAPEAMVKFVEAFCTGQSAQELPSCNLLLRVRSGIRYPHVSSAEDHWLVAALLMFRAHRGCVVSEPVYSRYSLQGGASSRNALQGRWWRSRQDLLAAVRVWLETRKHGHAFPDTCQLVGATGRPSLITPHDALGASSTFLGWGMEGVVWRCGGHVFKRFYPGRLSLGRLREIQSLAARCPSVIPPFDILEGQDDALLIRTDFEDLRPVPVPIDRRVALEFLSHLYVAGVVTSNIKRDNLRLNADGQMLYIDIGNDITALSLSRFQDCAARTYSVTVLGHSDHEWARRPTDRHPHEALGELRGFAEFYRELILALHPLPHHDAVAPVQAFDHDDVTLLIKSCPQDHACVAQQVRHIVGGLCRRTRFRRRVLLIDPWNGPYLRQYASGNLTELQSLAGQLQRDGWIDEAWVSPNESAEVPGLLERWFGSKDVFFSHTGAGAPLFPQLWAFERVDTRYVLQLDLDVLLSLSDPAHDVVADMKTAIASADDVWCVGFNIPQAVAGFKPYGASELGHAPEVRCGFLDLYRVMRRRPYQNPVFEGRHTLMWHRALEQAQRSTGMSSVRGGDSRSVYIHPRNVDKVRHPDALHRARDLMAQGVLPVQQQGQWDWASPEAWQYPRRAEAMVFMLLGRDTPRSLLRRCLSSLRMQTWQGFGVVLIDDGGVSMSVEHLHLELEDLKPRTTLIRRPARVGYIANFRTAVQDICCRSDTLVVVLDQDDALMHPRVAERLYHAWAEGADLVNAPMFRPDKPLHLYPVTYEDPRRHGGGNVWAHLRAFRKSLFEQIPAQCLSVETSLADCASDWLTMLPMAEMARRPVHLDDRYAYLHERPAYDLQRKRKEQGVKRWLFAQPPLGTSIGDTEPSGV